MNKTLQSLKRQMQPSKAVKDDLLSQVRNGRRAELKAYPRHFISVACVAVLLLALSVTGIWMLNRRINIDENSSRIESYHIVLSSLKEVEQAEPIVLPPKPEIEKNIVDNNSEITFDGKKYTLADDLEIHEQMNSNGINMDAVIGTGTVSAYGQTHDLLVTTVDGMVKDECVALWMRENSCHLYKNLSYTGYSIKLHKKKYDDVVSIPTEPPSHDTQFNIIANCQTIKFDNRSYWLDYSKSGAANDEEILGWGTAIDHDDKYDVVVVGLSGYTAEEYIVLYFGENNYWIYRNIDYTTSEDFIINFVGFDAKTANADSDDFTVEPKFFDTFRYSKQQILDHITSGKEVINLHIDDDPTQYLFVNETDIPINSKPYAKGTLIIDSESGLIDYLQICLYKAEGEDAFIVQMQDGTKLYFKKDENYDPEPLICEQHFIRCSTIGDRDSYAEYTAAPDDLELPEDFDYSLHIDFSSYTFNSDYYDLIDECISELRDDLERYRTDLPLLENGFAFNWNGYVYGVSMCRTDLLSVESGDIRYIYEKEGNYANFTSYGKNYRIPDRIANILCRCCWDSELLCTWSDDHEDEKIDVILNGGYKIDGESVILGRSMDTIVSYDKWVNDIISGETDAVLLLTTASGDYPQYKKNARTISLYGKKQSWTSARLTIDDSSCGEIPMNNGMGGTFSYNLVIDTGNERKLYYISSKMIFELEKIIKGHIAYKNLLNTTSYKKDVTFDITKTYAEDEDAYINEIALDIDQMELYEIMEGISEITFDGKTYYFTGEFGGVEKRIAAEGKVTADDKSYTAYLCFAENGDLLLDMHTSPAVFRAK